MTRVVQKAGLALILAVTAGPFVADAQPVRRGGGAAGFTANTLARNDDESTDLVNLGFTANFFGTSGTQLYVNNNGNVTFSGPLDEFTPFGLTGATSNPIIAAFFADVDTRNLTSAVTQYGTGTIDGRAAFGVNWDGVGYYDTNADKLNIFQLILIDRSDTGAGNFDIEFNYDRILWETGDVSGGTNGFGGTSAAVGYSSGAGTPGSSFQLTGSFVNGALLDNGANALVRGSLNSNVLGRYLFTVRGGTVVTPPPPPNVVPEPATVALVGAGVLTLAGVARRRRING